MGIAVITTVVTAAAAVFQGQQAYDLVDLAAVKSELQIGDASKDADLKRWITQASAAAAKFANRVFVLETVQDQFFPDRDPVAQVALGTVNPLQLTRWPISDASKIVVVENGITLTAATDYLIDAELGALTRLDVAGWPRRWPKLAIAVTYPAGYDVKGDPNFADAGEAVIRMVKARSFAQARDPALRAENVEGAWSAQYWSASGPGANVGDLAPDIEAMLERYRVPVTG